MRSSSAYFAGAGTVIVAIAAGLGGGLLISNIVSPHQPKYGSVEMTRMERRVSEPIPATSKSLEPVPYLAAPQISAAVADNSPPQPQPPTQPSPTQATQASAQQPQAPAQQPSAPQPSTQAAATRPAPSPAAQPVAIAESPAARERIAPDESVGKARDADVRREARRAEEKRRAERRQQWAERRKPRPREGDDLRDVERAVREETEPTRVFSAEPIRMEVPRIRLFGEE
jgi:hypothetical protein